jgi:AcrR family transcriptional regulator
MQPGVTVVAADVRATVVDDRERIVQAAWVVLRRAGYQNLKMQLVARTAGVSIGALYRTFGSKEAVLAAVFREELTGARRILTERCAEGTPAERVEAWVSALVWHGFGRQSARARWFSTLPDEVLQLARDGSDPAMDTGDPLRKAIADGIADGSFPNADAEWDALLIVQLCTQLCTSRSTWREADAQEAVTRVVDFVLGTLRRGTATASSERKPRVRRMQLAATS